MSDLGAEGLGGSNKKSKKVHFLVLFWAKKENKIPKMSQLTLGGGYIISLWEAWKRPWGPAPVSPSPVCMSEYRTV